jgi:tripartite-type tricarboxylate transporter receptor subunit TctC
MMTLAFSCRRCRTAVIAFAVLIGLMSFPLGAAAQAYPNHTVKIVVVYVPGGGPDLIARILARKLTQLLGQTFFVENKPGTGGTLATTLVARAPADGYTLLLGETGQLEIAPFMVKNLPYDPIKDFTPVGQVGGGAGMAIVANSKTSIKTLQDLIQQAKDNPGGISYGSTGIGSIHHVAMESFAEAAGINLVHVPYKGGGETIQAVLRGDVPIIMTGLSTAWPYLNSGAVTLISVTSAARMETKPNVPELVKLYKIDAFDSDTGILGPAGTPPDVVAKLSKAIRQATESQDFISSFKTIGQSIYFSTPEEYAETIRVNLKRYERAVKVAKIRPE